MVAKSIRPSDSVIDIGMIPESEHMPSLEELDERARKGETIVGLDDSALRGEYNRRYFGRLSKEGPKSIRRFR